MQKVIHIESQSWTRERFHLENHQAQEKCWGDCILQAGTPKSRVYLTLTFRTQQIPSDLNQ